MRFLRATLCALALAAASIEPAAAQAWQPHDSIRAAAEQLAGARAGTGGRVVATADTLDPRLKLAACAVPLGVALPYASAGRARVTVEVTCSAPTPWRVFVPVLMQAFGPVVVAAHALPRDTVLSVNDLHVEEREINSLSRGHIAEPTQAVGLKLRRALPAGAPITPAVVATPAAIKRGQTVTVKAASQLISVAMTGTALEDGYIGQVIDVTNDSSGKRVQAIVRSARVVEVLLN
jgi:flagella basal body P-ring formation protein FlgA